MKTKITAAKLEVAETSLNRITVTDINAMADLMSDLMGIEKYEAPEHTLNNILSHLFEEDRVLSGYMRSAERLLLARVLNVDVDDVESLTDDERLVELKNHCVDIIPFLKINPDLADGDTSQHTMRVGRDLVLALLSIGYERPISELQDLTNSSLYTLLRDLRNNGINDLCWTEDNPKQHTTNQDDQIIREARLEFLADRSGVVWTQKYKHTDKDHSTVGLYDPEQLKLMSLEELQSFVDDQIDTAEEAILAMIQPPEAILEDREKLLEFALGLYTLDQKYPVNLFVELMDKTELQTLCDEIGMRFKSETTKRIDSFRKAVLKALPNYQDMFIVECFDLEEYKKSKVNVKSVSVKQQKQVSQPTIDLTSVRFALAYGQHLDNEEAQYMSDEEILKQVIDIVTE